MKRKTSIVVSVLFLLAFTAAWLSPQGYAFWYGDLLPEEGGFPGAPKAPVVEPLNEVLLEIQPALLGEMIALGFGNPYPPLGLTKPCEPGKCWEGYTLLSCNGGYVDDMGTPDDESDDVVYPTILIDMDGNIVRKWPLTAFPAKMLPHGHVIGGEGSFLLPGEGAVDGVPALVQMDWHGNIVWRWDGEPLSEPKRAGWHHDFQRQGNPVGYYAPMMNPNPYGGNTLILSDYLPPMNETCPDPDDRYHPIDNPTGCISQWPLWDAAIYEVDYHTKEITWEYYTWEHIGEMGFDQAALDGIFNSFSGVVNPENVTDYIHTNTAGYVGPNKWYSYYHDERFHPDNIIWCSRQTNIIAIVSKETKEIVWKIGPDYSWGNPEYAVGQIIGPHMPHLIPKGLPGEGNMMLFDNGGFAGYGGFFPGMPGTQPNKFRTYSRVIEFNPRTMKVVWEYTFRPKEEGVRPFFSAFISGAQRLLNGNTMITEGGTGRIFEVNKDGEIVWEFINPWRGPVSGPPTGVAAVYRAYRVPYGWAGR